MRVRWLIPTGAMAVVQVAYATQYMTVEQAQHAAFPQAQEFRLTEPPSVATIAALGAPAAWSPHIYDARSGKRRWGWLLVDRVVGKSELITYALAVDPTGAVISVEILDYRESHGAEIRMKAWRKQFVGKTASDPVALDRDIKNISGATLSCRHVTDGVRRLLHLVHIALEAKSK